MAAEQSTYVVVGAGLAGAATGRRLAERPATTSPSWSAANPPTGEASSTARPASSAMPLPRRSTTDLVVPSRPLWSELEAAAGEQLITRSGCLDWGEQRDPWRSPAPWRRPALDNELLECGRRLGAMGHRVRLVGALAARRGGHRRRTCGDRDGGPRRLARSRPGHRTGRPAASSGPTAATGCVGPMAAAWTPNGWFSCRRLPAPVAAELGLDSRFVAAMPSPTVTQEQAFHFPYRDSGNTWPTFINKANDIQTYGLPGGRDAGFSWS